MVIAPLDRGKSLAELAYEHLKALILDRKLLPGKVVTEVWLSEQLGVSRTPVRQAVSRLASEGLLSIDNGRIQVRRISVKEAQDVSDFRIAIEGYVARLLAERGMSDAALKELRQMNDSLESLVDPEGGCKDTAEFIRINRLFHRRLAEETGNALLLDAAERVMDQVVLSGISTLSTRARARRVVDDHNEILNAILAADPDEAYRAARAHAHGLGPSGRHELFTPDEDDVGLSLS